MATLTTQEVDLDGVEVTFASAAGGGDSFTPSSRTFLWLKNASGGDITVTVDTPGTVIGLAVANSVTTVQAGEDRLIGPFPYEHFAQTDGLADITYSGVTTLTVAVLKLKDL